MIADLIPLYGAAPEKIHPEVALAMPPSSPPARRSSVRPLGSFRSLAALAALAAAGCAPGVPSLVPGPAPGNGEHPHVVVISIDGLRPDAIRDAGATTLAGLAEGGAWTWEAETIVPSKTLPSHTSMLTGVGPEVHGIDWNNDRTEERGTVRVPTAFQIAHDAGLGTAAFFAKAKLRHLIRPGSLDWASAPQGAEVLGAARMVGDVTRYLRSRSPDLLFVHLAEPDLAGHGFGWRSAPYRWAVRRADAAVGRIVAAANRAFDGNVVVIVTADHGGDGRTHGSAEANDVQIPWIAWGAGVRPGQLPKGIRTVDTAATALWLLGVPVPDGWAGRPVRAVLGAAATAP